MGAFGSFVLLCLNRFRGLFRFGHQRSFVPLKTHVGSGVDPRAAWSSSCLVSLRSGCFSRVICNLLLRLRLHLNTSLRGARRPTWPPLQPTAGHGIFCSTVSPPRCRSHQLDAQHKAKSKWHLELASRGEGGFRGGIRQCNNASVSLVLLRVFRRS